MSVQFSKISIILLVDPLLLAACSSAPAATPTPTHTPRPLLPTLQPAASTPQPVVPTATGLAPVVGSFNDCPPGAGPKSYELQAWGLGGFIKSQRSLVVRHGYAPPTAEPAPQPPLINSFTANPPQLDAIYNCTVLQWQVTGQAIAAIWLSRNGQLIAGPDVTSGYQDCVAVSEEGNAQIHELKVDTEFGGSTSEQLTVPFGRG